jgi:hypothetical protein
MSDSKKKVAINRVEKAEALLYRAADLLEQAQTQLSVLVGVHTNFEKIGKLREQVKGQMYALESVRAAGMVLADELVTR